MKGSPKFYNTGVIFKRIHRTVCQSIENNAIITGMLESRNIFQIFGKDHNAIHNDELFIVKCRA